MCNEGQKACSGARSRRETSAAQGEQLRGELSRTQRRLEQPRRSGQRRCGAPEELGPSPACCSRQRRGPDTGQPGLSAAPPPLRPAAPPSAARPARAAPEAATQRPQKRRRGFDRQHRRRGSSRSVHSACPIKWGRWGFNASYRQFLFVKIYLKKKII